MATYPRRRKKRLVLDIGASAIRLCELSPTKTGYQLTRYAQKEYDSDPALDEDTRRGLRRQALLDLLKETKSRTRKTIFAVPGQSVFTRSRALPPVPEYKVSQIVRYEIQQQIPFALDQIAMDYQILNRTEAGGYEVMMAAIKVDVVEKHLEVLSAAKRTVDTVDVCPLAAYNWLKHTGEFGDQGECVALIDVGAATTDIVIERDGQFRFTRPLNLGGNDVTQAIASAFGMSFSEAERLKRERGFAPTGDPQRDGKGGEVIGAALQRFISEVLRSFSYFRSLPGGGPVNRVVLCGGGATLRNFVPYLQQQLGVDVRIAQPLSGIAVTPGAQQVSDRPEQACVCLGLALRCCQDVPIAINLVPPRVLEAVRRREQVFYWAMSLATLALIMASTIPVNANENKNVLQRIEQLKRYIAEYDPEIIQRATPDAPPPPSVHKRELDKWQDNVNTLKQDVTMLDQLRANRRFWLDEMVILNDARPATAGIWFSALETSFITEGPAEESIAEALASGVEIPGMKASSRTPSRRGGGAASVRRRRMDDDGAPSAMPAPAAAAAAPGIPGVQEGVFSSTGFPGLDGRGETSGPMGGSAGSGRGGGIGGFGANRNDDEEDMNNMTGSGTPSVPGATAGDPFADPPVAPIPPPNGFEVTGFAENDQVVKEYVENLKKSEISTPTGQYLRVKYVRFFESDVQLVPNTVLLNAPTDVNASVPTNQQQTYAPPATNMYAFILHVKYARSLTKGGEELPEPTMLEVPGVAPAAAAAGPSFTLGGGGGGGLLSGGLFGNNDDE